MTGPTLDEGAPCNEDPDIPVDVHDRATLTAYIKHGVTTTKQTYSGVQDVGHLTTWCLAVCGASNDSGEAPQDVLLIQDADRTDVWYELDTWEFVYDHCVLELHREANAGPEACVAAQLDSLDYRIDGLLQTVIKSRCVSEVDIVAVDGRNRISQITLNLSADDDPPPQPRKCSLAWLLGQRRRSRVEFVKDECQRLRNAWKDLRYDTVKGTTAFGAAVRETQESLVGRIVRMGQAMSPVQRTRVVLHHQLRQYVGKLQQANNVMEDLSVVTNEVTKEVVMYNIRPLDCVLAHAAALVAELTDVATAVQQHFENIEGLITTVWQGELGNVVKEEAYLQSEKGKMRDFQMVSSRTANAFARLVTLLKARETLPFVCKHYGREDLAGRPEVQKALLKEIEATRRFCGSHRRQKAQTEMERWRAVVGPLQRQKWDTAEFNHSLRVKKTELHSVKDDARAQARERLMASWLSTGASPQGADYRKRSAEYINVPVVPHRKTSLAYPLRSTNRLDLE